MGKTAVVTGGSRGRGKAIALQLAQEGYDIALNYANNDAAAEAAKEEIAATGVRCEIYKADTSDIVQVKDMFKAIKKAFETIDVLVNNAGVVDDAYLLMIRQILSLWTNLCSLLHCPVSIYVLRYYTLKLLHQDSENSQLLIKDLNFSLF